MLMKAPMIAASAAASGPAPNDPDRHADQNPVTRRRPTPTYVETAERTEKSSVGTNQSSAVLATAARPKSAPQTPTLRIQYPVTCVTYHTSACSCPLAG